MWTKIPAGNQQPLSQEREEQEDQSQRVGPMLPARDQQPQAQKGEWEEEEEEERVAWPRHLT